MTTAFDKDLELIFQKLTSDRQVKQALDFLKQDAPNTIAQQKELVVIEAPTFQEKQRSLHYAQMLKAAGLQDVTIDEKFNVCGKIYGSGKTGKSVLLEGHLDTVFSFGTVTDVIEKGELTIQDNQRFALRYKGKTAIIEPQIKNNRLTFLFTAYYE